MMGHGGRTHCTEGSPGPSLTPSSKPAVKEERVKCTLMIPRRKEDNAIFLAKKARGFGTGKWMGFGGKLERGESVPHANLREFYEETGVKVSSCDCSKVGLLLFTFKTKPGFYLEVHVYETYKMLNPIALCDELSGNGQWFPPDCVPFDGMWKDFAIWSPKLYSNRQFIARICYDDFKSIMASVIGDSDAGCSEILPPEDWK